MTEKKRALLLHSVRHELSRLHRLEIIYNPNWRFWSAPYSKRRARLVRMFWALKRGETV